ncbi:MAG: hypothetical protein ACI4V7_07675 [Succinivibrionaceae bacterium]
MASLFEIKQNHYSLKSFIKYIYKGRVFSAIFAFLLLFGCSSEQKDKLCATPHIIKNLSTDFSYSLYSNINLPKVEYKSIHYVRNTDSIIWCNALLQLPVDENNISQVLIAIYGEKKWKKTYENILKNINNYSKQSAKDLRTKQNALSIYLVKKYQNVKKIETEESYSSLNSMVFYAVNKKNNNLVSADYSKSLYKQALSYQLSKIRRMDEDDYNLALKILEYKQNIHNSKKNIDKN